MAPSVNIRRRCGTGKDRKGESNDGEVRKFWQFRYKAVKLVDAEAILACAAYVDLNPIRTGIAETLEESDHIGPTKDLGVGNLRGRPPTRPLFQRIRRPFFSTGGTVGNLCSQRLR